MGLGGDSGWGAPGRRGGPARKGGARMHDIAWHIDLAASFVEGVALLLSGTILTGCGEVVSLPARQSGWPPSGWPQSTPSSP
jgi:hypothetical protein